MEVTIPVPAVKSVLTGMSKVIKPNRLLPQLDSLWIQPAQKGVSIIGTNTDEHLLYECPDAIYDGEEGFFIESSALRSFMQVIRGDTVSINVLPETLELKFYEDMWSATVEMPRLDATPVVKHDDVFTGWETQAPGTMLQDYVFALPFISTDSTRHVLNGVCFAHNGDICATDGRRMLFKGKAHNLGISALETRIPSIPGIEPMKHEDLIVPNTRFLRTVKPEKVDGIQVTPQHNLRVSLPGWKYVANCVEGTYPNYKQVIPETTPEPFFELGNNAIDAFRFIETLATSREMPAVKIHPMKTKAKLTMTAENHRAQRKVTVDMEGCGDGTIKTVSSVNPCYFIDALERGFRRFHQADKFSPLVSHHDGWTHVLMPMRSE